ncbi:MAG TPA: contractile injection system tape measure protein [Chitinophagaceae bacterium]|nr:contractile injection system tape measure protein [Chitinophagaceae bacterium]
MADLLNFKSDQQRTLLGFMFLLQNGELPQWLPDYKEKDFEQKVEEALISQAAYYRKHFADRIITHPRALERWASLFSDEFRMRVLTSLNNAPGRGILVFKAILENKLRIFLAPDYLKHRFDLLFWQTALPHFSGSEPLDKNSFFSSLEKDLETSWWKQCGPVREESYSKRLQLLRSLAPTQTA